MAPDARDTCNHLVWTKMLDKETEPDINLLVHVLGVKSPQLCFQAGTGECFRAGLE